MSFSDTVMSFLKKKWIFLLIIMVLIASIVGSLIDEINAMNVGTTCSFGFFFILFLGPMFCIVIGIILFFLLRTKNITVIFGITYLTHFIIQYSFWVIRKQVFIQDLINQIWPFLTFNLYHLNNRFDWKTAVIVSIFWSIGVSLLFLFISWIIKEDESG